MVLGKMFKIIPKLLLFLTFWGCYSELIESVGDFRFQIPLYFYVNYYDKSIPDTSRQFANLNNYDEFVKNQAKLSGADIVQFNYWIDSLVFSNGKPFDPNTDSMVIENVKIFLVFAKPKTGISNPVDSNDFEPDTTLPKFILGEFKNISVADYYRKPHHIFTVSTEISQVLTEVVRNRPYFYLISEYGRVAGDIRPKKYFKLIFVRFDIVIRFIVDF